MNSNIETLATVRIEPTADVYKIVDLLNRTLKGQDLMFGLALEKKVNDPKKKRWCSPSIGRNDTEDESSGCVHDGTDWCRHRI